MIKQTIDRSSPFYAPHAIGASRRITPEGYLLCEGVAIARVGTQVYGAHELPELEPDLNGLIYIERTAEEVFDPESMASWNGKAITINHPEEFVTPANWRSLSTGSMQNPRRGQGSDSDLLLVDVLITDKAAVEYANRELPELSGGYEAEYEQTAPGRGKQRKIRGNHVAMLKNGRAGKRCAIRDDDSTFIPFTEQELSMKNKTLVSRVLASLGVKEPDVAVELIAQASGETAPAPTTDAAHPAIAALQGEVTGLKTSMTAIEETLKKLVPPEPAKPAVVTTDKVLELGDDALKDIVSRAEILSPGIVIPSAAVLKTADGLKGLLIASLDKAIATTDSAANVAPFLLGREVKALTSDALLGVFNGAAELARAKNNAKVSATPKFPGQQTNPFIGTRDGKPVTTADRLRSQQQANSDFWAKHKAS